jgi:hypothetical protein
MSRTRHNDNPVSLFPFLTVLMCTMGALIFLLIVVSTSIKEDAIAAASRLNQDIDADSKPKPGETVALQEVDIPDADLGLEGALPDPPPAAKPIVAEVQEPQGPTFEEIQAELAKFSITQAKLQNALNIRQQQAERLQAELAKANAEAARIENQAAKVDGEFQVSLARVRSAKLALATAKDDSKRFVRLINESQELAELRKLDNAKASSEYVIVPYDGATGTTRRPIILDCTDDAIRLVGEDIELTPDQLLGFSPITNPLKSGVRELIRFWANRNAVQENPRKEPVSYVLLIVRPSGTVAFYVARKYLQTLGADFGYELVEEDFAFRSEKSPDRAVELCRSAILATLRANRADGGRRANSFLDSLRADARQNVRRAVVGSRIGDGTPRSRTKGPGQGGSFDDLTNSGKAMQRWDSREFNKRGGRASQGFFGSTNFQNRQSHQQGSPSIDDGQKSPGSADGRRKQTDPAGAGNNRVGSTQDRMAPLAAPLADFLNHERGKSGENSETPNEKQSSARSTIEPGLLDDGSRTARSIADSANGRTPKNQGSETGSPFERAGSIGDPNADRQNGAQNMNRSGGQGQSAMSPSGLAGRQPERAAVQPTIQLNRNRSKNRHRFRRQWGIPNPNGTIALEQSLIIRLSDQRVVIGDRLQIRITEDRLPAQIVEWTVEAMDRVARDWGKPPTRFYWSPAVRLVVEPGGDLMLERMARTLRQYGVSVDTFSAP